MRTELDLELETIKAELEYLKKQNKLLEHKVEMRDKFIANTEPQIDETYVSVKVSGTIYFNHHMDHDYDVNVDIKGESMFYSMLNKEEVRDMIKMLKMLHTDVDVEVCDELDEEFE